MVIETSILGQVAFSEEDIVSFPEGIYGFGEMSKFIVINIAEPELPFQWLQSIEDGELSFILTNPFLFCESYDFELPTAAAEALNIDNLDDLAVYTLVVLKDDIKDATINLKAPLILNLKSKVGKQVILNEEFPYKYNIFK